jgi:Zn-dependent protease with chaperone function
LIKGFLFDTKTSKRIDIVLYIKGDTLEVVTPQNRHTYNLDTVRFSARLGNTPRSIYLPDGTVCESGENDAIDAVIKSRSRPDASLWLHKLESKYRYLLMALVTTAAFTYAFVTFGLPALSEYVAKKLPGVVVYNLGTGTLKTLDSSIFGPTELNASRIASLQKSFAPYIKHDSSWPHVRVEFRSSNIGANALALPDGTIVFTDDLVKLAKDDRELVSIFFHELGHIQNRHALRMILQDSAFFLVLSAIVGDATTASSLFSTLPTVLVESHYSRDLEREADDYAYEQMKLHGIDHEYFATIMERLMDSHSDNSKGIVTYIQSHPDTSERIAKFRHTKL